ncbi:MAG: hypothetical protein ACRDF7_11550, partial [Candidatus Limnocylindrales bacterium]
MTTAYKPSREAAFWMPEKPSRAPVEGWSTLLILAVMLAVLGFAVDDARWVGSTAAGTSRTSFMPLVLLLSGGWGLLGAKLRLRPILVHLVGAVAGALIVIVFVANAVSVAPELAARIKDLLTSMSTFVTDIGIRHIRSSQVAPFLLGTGLVAWATGQFAAFAVFRRNRPMDAILVTGLAMLVNLSLTFQPEFTHLVVFAAAALLLLIRSNLLKQHAGWLRRRTSEAGDVSDLFMRSGMIFVAVALSGALALTT